jgi:hypothetical protein
MDDNRLIAYALDFLLANVDEENYRDLYDLDRDYEVSEIEMQTLESIIIMLADKYERTNN